MNKIISQNQNCRQMNIIKNFYGISNPDIIWHVIITCIVAGSLLLLLQQAMFRYADKKRKKKEAEVMEEFELLVKETKKLFEVQTTIETKQKVIDYFVKHGLALEQKATKSGDIGFAALVAIKTNRIENLLSSLIQIDVLADRIDNIGGKKE
jgi:hypothetical protein